MSENLLSGSFFQFEKSKTREVWTPSTLFSVVKPFLLSLNYPDLQNYYSSPAVLMIHLIISIVETDKVMFYFLTLSKLCRFLVRVIWEMKQVNWSLPPLRLKLTVGESQNNLHIIPLYMEDPPPCSLTLMFSLPLMLAQPP